MNTPQKGDSPQAAIAFMRELATNLRISWQEEDGGTFTGSVAACEWAAALEHHALMLAPLPQPSPDSGVERFFVETPDAGVFGFDTLKDAKDCQRDMSGTVYTAKPSDAGSAEAVDATRWRALAGRWHWEDERDMAPGGRWWVSIHCKNKPTSPAEAVDAVTGQHP